MRKLLLPAGLAASLLLSSGCTDSHARTTATAPVAPPAATYKAGHGIQLSPAARAFAKIATVGFDGRLPVSALLRTARGNFVFVDNGGWFLRTPVIIAHDDGLTFTLKEGLYDGDIVVTHGVTALWLAELQAVNGGVGCADGH
jgi:hypothetical protein